MVDAHEYHCYYMFKKSKPPSREDDPSPEMIGPGQGHNAGYTFLTFLLPNSEWVSPQTQAASEAIKGFLNCPKTQNSLWHMIVFNIFNNFNLYPFLLLSSYLVPSHASFFTLVPQHFIYCLAPHKGQSLWRTKDELSRNLQAHDN